MIDWAKIESEIKKSGQPAKATLEKYKIPMWKFYCRAKEAKGKKTKARKAKANTGFQTFVPADQGLIQIQFPNGTIVRVPTVELARQMMGE